MAVFTALTSAPPSSYVNVTRWYDHISALLRSRCVLELPLISRPTVSFLLSCAQGFTYLIRSGITAEGEGVKVEATCSVSSAPRVAEQKVTKRLYIYCFGGQNNCLFSGSILN